jgi:hypothetical protein
MPTELADEETSVARCASCGAHLIGDYCHACGQRRAAGRITVGAFIGDVARRVFRFDRAFALTFWRMLCAPGGLVRDYLAGRRQGYLDPIQYFISSVFVQFCVAATTREFAPLLNRLSAINWLESLTGVVAVKILIIFWMGTLWRLLFRPIRYTLGEIYVFATYAFATTGLLWALLPVVDLIVPYPLGANPVWVAITSAVTEAAYLTYAVRRFSLLPLSTCLFRVGSVLALGYSLLAVFVGLEHTVHWMLPPLSPRS